jgi:Fic family protein
MAFFETPVRRTVARMLHPSTSALTTAVRFAALRLLIRTIILERLCIVNYGVTYAVKLPANCDLPSDINQYIITFYEDYLTVKYGVKYGVRMDWSAFDFEFQLEAGGIISDVILIEAYREAAQNLVLPPDWRAQLARLNRIRAIHGTTALEGNPLSEAEVSQQMDLIDQPAANPALEKATKEQIQIRNAGLAQSWVRERFRPDTAPITVEDILGMHRMITENSDMVNNVPGKFRTFSVVVGSSEMGGVHRGAPSEDLARLMDEYVSFVNSRKMLAQHPVIRALLSHFFLVTIHPFGDGNGRLSRLVEAGILFQGGYNVFGFYGLSNYFYRNGGEYKTCLQGCRDQQPFDVTPFIVFGLKGFAAELKGINNFIKTKLNRVVYRAMLVRAFNKKTGDRRRLLNQREYQLLHFLLTETEPVDPFSESPSKKIQFSELREISYIKASYAKVSTRTFYRELLRLGQLGFINFNKDGSDWILEVAFEAIGKY